MEALFRILALLLVLLAQALLKGPFGVHSILRISAPTKAPTATASPQPTSTAMPSSTTAAAVPSFTNSVTPVPTMTPTLTVIPSDTPTVRPTATHSLTVSATATLTVVPSATPSATATITQTWTSTVPPTFTASPIPTAGSVASDPTGFDVVGVPPAQKLPAALLIYPLVQASATQETRIELMNLTSASVSVECFYVTSVTCNETGFLVTLTASQPLSWLASTGMGGNGSRIAPPFSGEGELKCVVTPRAPDLNSHNALQGRALIWDAAQQTVGYNAIAFRRLTPGDFTGVVSLDGVTYEQCPDRLHFSVLTSQPGSDSELVLVPCSEDLEGQVAGHSTIQFAVMNEFEQHSSGAATLACYLHQPFHLISALRRSQVGTDTAHVIVRGIDFPVVGLVIDRFTVPGSGALSTSSNEPYLEGGRSAGVNLP
jgi:hypothetical protein